MGRDDGHPAGAEVHMGRDGLREGVEQGRAAADGTHFQTVAGAEVQDIHDLADQLAVFKMGGEADEVGMVIFLLLRRRQVGLADVEIQVHEGFCGGTVVHALDAGDEHVVADVPQALEGEAADAIGADEGAIVADGGGVSGEALQPHFAAHPMGRAKASHKHEVTRGDRRCGRGSVRHQGNFLLLRQPEGSSSP